MTSHYSEPLARFQERVDEWVLSTFGEETRNDATERSLRTAEEAIELAQACGVTPDALHKLIDYVYSRPSGHAGREVAGTILCALATATALNSAAAIELDYELKRVQAPEVIERCRRRQLEKRERFG